LELAAYYPESYYGGLEPDDGDARRRTASLRGLRKQLRRALLQRFYCYPTPNGELQGTGTGPLALLKTACMHVERWRLRIGGREAAIIPFRGEGRLLDVGCAGGWDLQRFQEMGWKVTGVEFSPTAASVARARLGCEVLVGDFEEVPLRDGTFDVVRFSHTLEHLPSPRRALERAHRVLRPEGRLFIEVPNVASLDRRIFGRHWAGWRLPQHLYHFTPKTLRRLLVRTGFQPVKITCHGRTAFVVESLLNVVTDRFSIRLRRTKWLSILARPLAYAAGMVRRGMILSVHAEKCMGGHAGPSVRTADRPWCERPE
jgi:SAM-dependent methyltransferase